MVSIIWSMGKKYSDEKVIFSKFVIRLKSQSKSKHNELTLFCFCHNKNKEKNNPNIQDLSELVVLNLVKRLNSKRKIKLCWLRKMIFNLNFMVSCFFCFALNTANIISFATKIHFYGFRWEVFFSENMSFILNFILIWSFHPISSRFNNHKFTFFSLKIYIFLRDFWLLFSEKSIFEILQNILS